MNQWTLAQVAYLMQQQHSGTNAAVTGFSVDTRLLKDGNIFFALSGANVDGHSYLAEAAAKKVAGAVVSKSYQGPDYNLPLFRVNDPLDSLQNLSAAVLKVTKPTVVAVTGSLGKTTTKDFITVLLKSTFKVASSPGNSNSQIGLPLTILNQLQGDEDIVVLEMGMTHPGQIAKLVGIAPPKIAVLTSVNLVHACNFSSISEIAKAKSEIFGHPHTILGIIPRDISTFADVVDEGFCQKKTFSLTRKDVDLYLEERKGGFQLHTEEKTIALPELEIPGKHNRSNLLAAIAVAHTLGVSWKAIQKAIPTLELPERRLQLIEKKGVLFVNDSYNASEASVKAALECLPKPKRGQKTIAVIGEMLELGVFSSACHLAVGEAALSQVDCMICLGKECGPIVKCWQKANRPVAWCASLEEVVVELRKLMQPNDVVLLKGSRKNGLWNVLTALDKEL